MTNVSINIELKEVNLGLLDVRSARDWFVEYGGEDLLAEPDKCAHSVSSVLSRAERS